MDFVDAQSKHEAQERHFRRVSRAFFALGAVVFIAGSVSLGQDAQVQATSLHVQQTRQVAPPVPAVAKAFTPSTQVLRAQAEESDPTVSSLDVSAPLITPGQSSKLATGGLLGAVAMVSGLFYMLQRRPAQAFDPMAVPPVSHYSMVSAAGEESGLLSKPTLKAPQPQPTYVTVEYQRKQAKALFEYFEEQEQAALRKNGQVLGWTPNNEIGNGRWVMFGWLVGMMTEYATGVSFVEQIKLTLNNLAILDLD